jgi:hypothetical protein
MMFWTKSRRTLITFCLVFLIGLFLSTLPMPVIAQSLNLHVQGRSRISQPATLLALELKDERRPLPGRREPAAGRGCGVDTPNPPLTALSPATNLGFTVAAYPKFFFYIPQMSAQAVKFSLIKEDKDKVYEKTFPIPNTPGIFNLSLPTDKTLPPLEVGKGYRWYFQIICSQQDSGDIYVDGWVQRIPGAGKNNLWYDSLATLAQNRRLNAGDVVSTVKWANLLRAEGLDKITQEPLVGSLSGGEF